MKEAQRRGTQTRTAVRELTNLEQSQWAKRSKRGGSGRRCHRRQRCGVSRNTFAGAETELGAEAT